MRVNYGQIVKKKSKDLKQKNISFKLFFELIFDKEHDHYTFFEEYLDFKLKKYTYKEIKTLVLQSACYLKTKLSEEDFYIGLKLENSVEYIILFLSLLMIGKNVVLINPTNNIAVEGLRVDKTISKEINCEGDIVVNDFIELIKDIRFDESLLNNEFGEEVIFISSGTSLKPKACVYTATNIFNELNDSLMVVRKNKNIIKTYKGLIKVACLLPFYHVFGMLANFLWLVIYHPTFVMIHSKDPSTFLSLIKLHGVTHIFCVPLFFESIHRKLLFRLESNEKDLKMFKKAMKIAQFFQITLGSLGIALSRIILKKVRNNLFGPSVKFMISGGSPINKETIKMFNLLGYLLYNGYGSTEIGILSVQLSNRYKNRTSTSIGKAFSHYKYKIEDNELLIHKDSMSRLISDTYCFSNNEYYHTKDVVWEDSRKKLYFVERNDDVLLNSNGEKSYPTLIEKDLKFVRCIEKFFIIVIDNKNFLFIEFNEDYNEFDKDIINDNISTNITNLLARNIIISKIVFTFDSLLGGDFKLSRKKIVERYLAGKIKSFEFEGSVALDKKVDLSKVYNLIVDLIRRNFNRTHDISMTTNFFTDLGFSSFEYYSLTNEIEKELEIRICISKTFPTVLELIEEIQKVIGSV